MSDTIDAQVEAAASAGEVDTNQDHEDVAPATPGKKRGAAAPKLDADGNPLPKTPRKTATPKPKLDAEGNPIPKTPRATQKQPKVDADGNPVTKTPKKSATKAKAAVKTEGSQDEGSGSGGENNIALNDDVGDEANPPATPASKKRASNNGAASETPSKRVKNSLPTCKAELGEADKMLLEWKDAGRSWADIKAEWAKLTGKPVGGNSTLGNRYTRIKAALVELKDGDMERVLVAKEVIEKEKIKELEEFKIQHAATLASFEGKLEYGTWGRTAAMVESMGGDKYTGDAVQKAYSKEMLAGFPHKETEAYLALILKDAPIEQKGDDKDEINVDFNEEGSPVYTENTEEKTPGTVIHKKELHTDAPVKGVNGSRKGSLAEILADSTSGKSATEEDDGAVFN